MKEPQVLVLMLWVDGWSWRAVRDALRGLAVSHLLVELDEPLAKQMPDAPADEESLRKLLAEYVRDCRHVAFVVGGTGRPLEAFQRKLLASFNAREQGGRPVIRLELGGESRATLWPPGPPVMKIRGRDKEAVARFFKQAIAGTSEPGRSKGQRAKPPATGDTEFLGMGKGGDSLKSISIGDILGDTRELRITDDEQLEHPAPPSLPTGGDAPPEPDEILCSVYSPRLAAPGDEILVQAFAHLEGQEAEVAEEAAAAAPSAAKVGARSLDEKVAVGERLGFHLTLRGTEIDPPDQEFVWRGEPLAAQFTVYFPETSQPRDAVGTVIVTKDGVPVGHIKFTLRVVTREEKARAGAADAERQGKYSRYRKAFISYASKDREQVLPRVQALAAAHIDVFQDFVELEPGERWERELYKHINECDAFFLFWSQAARDSQWVRKEAEYAYERQEGKEDRPPEIIPIIIEGPPPVEPPPELNFLHFNDKYIYFMKAVEAEAEARRSEKK